MPMSKVLQISLPPIYLKFKMYYQSNHKRENEEPDKELKGLKQGDNRERRRRKIPIFRRINQHSLFSFCCLEDVTNLQPLSHSVSVDL